MINYNHETGTVSYDSTNEEVTTLVADKTVDFKFFTKEHLKSGLRGHLKSRQVELFNCLEDGKPFILYRDLNDEDTCYDTIIVQLSEGELAFEYQGEFIEGDKRKVHCVYTPHGDVVYDEEQKEDQIFGSVYNVLLLLKWNIEGIGTFTDEEIQGLHACESFDEEDYIRDAD